MLQKLALISLLLVLSVSSATAGGDFVDSSALHKAGLVKYWQLQLPLLPGQTIAASYLVDDQIYAATQDGYVFAVDAATGAIRWMKEVTTAGYPVTRPCHLGKQTVFVFPPEFVQYDRYSGRPLRAVETRFPIGSPAVSDGLHLYIGGIDQKIYSFFPGQDFETWKARADGQIVSRPEIFGDYLYFAGDDGTVYACRAENKEFYWRARKVGPITADLVVDENGVYVASRDHSLYLLDPAFGGLRWRTRFSGPLYEPPVATADTAFQYCAEDGLTAINTGTVGVEQRVRWIMPRGRKLLTVNDNQAYVFSRDESILVADLADGKLRHTVPTIGFTMPMASPSTMALYMAASDGRLFCARKQGVPVVLADDVRKALGGPRADKQEEAATEGGASATATDEDQLKSKRPGPPIGGKSKVSKEYTGD